MTGERGCFMPAADESCRRSKSSCLSIVSMMSTKKQLVIIMLLYCSSDLQSMSAVGVPRKTTYNHRSAVRLAVVRRRTHWPCIEGRSKFQISTSFASVCLSPKSNNGGFDCDAADIARGQKSIAAAYYYCWCCCSGTVLLCKLPAQPSNHY